MNRSLVRAVLAVLFVLVALVAPATADEPIQAGIFREVLRFGKPGMGPGQMNNARYVTVDRDGYIYVAERDAARVHRFNPKGKEDLFFWAEDRDRIIQGIAVDRTGVLWISIGGRLFRHEAATGKLLGEVEHPDGNGFAHIAPKQDGGVIATWWHARDDIVLIGRDGKISKIFRNAIGEATGDLVTGGLVAMDGRGDIYVVGDTWHRVYKLSGAGKYLTRFGSSGDGPGQLDSFIGGIVADGQGRLFISHMDGISVFDLEGRFLEILSMAASNGGLAMSDNDELFMARDSEVVKFELGKAKE